MISAALLKSPEVKTLMLGLNGMMNSGSTTSWPIYASASIVSTIPIMIIFISIQRHRSNTEQLPTGREGEGA